VRTAYEHVAKLIVRLAVLGLGVMTVSGCAGPRHEMHGIASAEQQAPSKWEANGIRVERIKPAVNGLMLDLRYRITDPEKARELVKKSTPLSLVDQASGKVLPVPDLAKVGKLRSVPNADDMGKVYWVFFNNPGGSVKPGNKVTLHVGDVQIKDITVE
jgi:hypothetical protein